MRIFGTWHVELTPALSSGPASVVASLVRQRLDFPHRLFEFAFRISDFGFSVAGLGCRHENPSTLLCAAIVALAAAASAETVKDREGSVRNDRATMEKDTRWIYNDWQQGLAEGKRRGMPVLVVLRCVPCLACAGIDAKVLDRETEIAPLLDQFVCVRVINANALDLSLFQFDYDLSFSTLFLNGDGTVYGRYGSWRQQKDPQDKTTAGYRRALEGALALHKGYPGEQGLARR